MPSIRQQVNIAAAPRAVWRMFTTDEGLASWWVDEARVEARPGGRIVLTSEGDDGEPVEERGIFHELRPTRRIEIAWDSTSPAPTKGTRITISLARDGQETRVVLVHHGSGVLEEEEAYAELDKGWRQALRGLRDVMETPS